MNQYYYRAPHLGEQERFVGPLIPFVGGLLLGGLFVPRPNFNYPPMSPYTPYVPPYGNGPYIPYNNYNQVNQEIPTYYSSFNNENINIYPYVNPRY